MNDSALCWIFVGCGLFSIAGGVTNMPLFWSSGKARSMVAMIGQTGARIFYVLLGSFLSGLGAAGLLGIVSIK